MQANVEEMKRIVEGLPSISAKIRALDAAGYARADIDLKRAALSQVVPEVLAPPKGKLAIDRADITGWLRAL